MKHLILLLCWPLFTTSAQTPSLQISTDKTITLVFPFAVTHIDRGTKDVLVQQVKEAEHVLLIKAGISSFSPTNLSVITSDGEVYSFNVTYNANPSQWIWHIPERKHASIATYANGILDNPSIMNGPVDRKFHMQISIEGIYMRDNIMYYQLRLFNESSISYDIDQLRFYIRDQKKRKRTAIQENEIQPLHITGNTSSVAAMNANVIVVAVEKFTIPDAKLFIIQLQEKNGGRHLMLKLRNRHLLKAKPLPAVR